MARLGVFDPTLEADTPLFIDPMLLRHSSAPEMVQAYERLVDFFSDLFRLLSASTREGDVAWQAAVQMLSFHEVPGTCLGYGGGSIRGSGWGERLTSELLNRAKEIIQTGVRDPKLFLLIGLFSEDVGPDRISDMTTNIIIAEIAAYTERVCDSLGVGLELINLGRRGEFYLPRNPYENRVTPIFLLPEDVLRDLPIALSVGEIWEAAAYTDALREGVNRQIGAVWDRVSREQKSEVLNALLRDRDYAQALIERLANFNPGAYDFREDECGHLIWADIAYEISGRYPRAIATQTENSLTELNRIVIAIIEQFKFLLEHRDLWRVLNDSDSRKKEKTAQRLFFAVAYSYCLSNGLDVTPEADTGNGPVDFKFSVGNHPKILVELKLSKNNIQHGHDVQLPRYVLAEQADFSHYVVIDVGNLRDKWDNLQARRIENNQQQPQVWLIDATERPSASVIARH